MSRQGAVKAIIFDCDGTLVDSEDAHIAAWRHALQNRGQELSLEQCLYCTGKSTTEIAKILSHDIGQDCSHDLLTEKRAYYRELHSQGFPPIEATVDFVQRLAHEKARLGLKLGVASAASKPEIFRNLRHLGIEELFDVILSGQDDLGEYSDPEGVNKPKPYIYLHAAKLLNVSPVECVVVEDSLTGIASAKAAGCITVAIPNRVTERQDLSAATLRMDTLSGVSVDHFLKMASASLPALEK